MIPLVEPVKLIPALNNALLAFQASSLPLGLIMNPSVRDLTDELETIRQLITKFSDNPNIIPSVLLNKSTIEVMNEMGARGINSGDTLVVFNNVDYIPTYQTLFSIAPPKYTLCPYDRYIRRVVGQNSVLFEDKFNKRNRNADYPEDEAFSNDHIDYEVDQYIGFGDYSIIGDEYIESGFAPYAVAIHIVYFADDNSLRIKHFISDSNDDISDVAGKFYEAISKLYRWYTSKHQERQLTAGLQTLLNHYINRTYPGLPTLKKLSIMHHLELMGKFLDGRLEK